MFLLAGVDSGLDFFVGEISVSSGEEARQGFNNSFVARGNVLALS